MCVLSAGTVVAKNNKLYANEFSVVAVALSRLTGISIVDLGILLFVGTVVVDAAICKLQQKCKYDFADGT